MKRVTVGVVGTLLVVSLGLGAQKDRSFTGEITDNECASMGSHAGMGKPAKECTLACVQRGARFVLFNAAAKTTYQLDDQKKPSQFAGQKVVVTGTIDEKSQTIHVTEIKAAP